MRAFKSPPFLLRGGRILSYQPTPQHVGVVHRGRQPNPPQARGEPLQPRHRQVQQVAPLIPVHGVDLVQDHHREIPEIGPAPRPSAEQGQLLGRGHQDVGREQPLALALVDAGVAGARLHGDTEAHLRDRRLQVAVHIHRQRLQRRDVQSMHAAGLCGGGAFRQLDQARQEAGQRLAAAGRSDQQGVTPGPRLGDHLQLMRADRPAAPGEPVAEAGRQQHVFTREAAGGSGREGVHLSPYSTFAFRFTADAPR